MTLALGCGGSQAVDEDGEATSGGEKVAVPFDELDANADGRIDEHEFFGAAIGLYDRWDLDDDGRLGRSELEVGMFQSWDDDGDGRIDSAEFHAGARVWLPASARELAAWDADRNGSLTRDEVRGTITDRAIFEALDRDGDASISDFELSSALFRYWDDDADQAIASSEWRWTAG